MPLTDRGIRSKFSMSAVEPVTGVGASDWDKAAGPIWSMAASACIENAYGVGMVISTTVGVEILVSIGVYRSTSISSATSSDTIRQ